MGYQISNRTRQRLIEAAGELFAAQGIEGTTTREIARAAGTVPNAITYHFGGIDGLTGAVWDRVLKTWQPEKFQEFLAAELTRFVFTPAAAAELVTKCIRRVFAIIHQEERPLWISRFLVRCSLTSSGGEQVARNVSGLVAPHLAELYLRITGSGDAEAARCWSLRILAAPVVFTAELTQFTKFRRDGRIDSGLYRKLEEMTCREALASAGLAIITQKEGSPCANC